MAFLPDRRILVTQKGGALVIVSARAGANFGWPIRSYGCNYGDPVGDACRIGGGTHAPAYVGPLTTWTPTSIAPSGLAFYTGSLMPEWQRIRDVRQGPDGALYLLTDNTPGRIIRVGR